jgi:hypothetical protein
LGCGKCQHGDRAGPEKIAAIKIQGVVKHRDSPAEMTRDHSCNARSKKLAKNVRHHFGVMIAGDPLMN